MRVFIAGASGAIGRVLCGLLVRDGWQVHGMTRTEQGAQALRELGVIPLVLDVFDPEPLVAAVRNLQPTHLVHQLTDLPKQMDPEKMPEALVRNARIREEGTVNLVQAAAAGGVKRFVAQSIAFAYAPGRRC